MKSIAKGVYVEGEPLHVEEPYLKGRINENGRTIVFITQKNDTINYVYWLLNRKRSAEQTALLPLKENLQHIQPPLFRPRMQQAIAL